MKSTDIVVGGLPIYVLELLAVGSTVHASWFRQGPEAGEMILRCRVQPKLLPRLSGLCGRNEADPFNSQRDNQHILVTLAG